VRQKARLKGKGRGNDRTRGKRGAPTCRGGWARKTVEIGKVK